jgi:hypothetical protein
LLALALKLTLAPLLVFAATRVARHIGHRAGGLLAGLPVVAGPIILIYAVDQGDRFARDAAAAGALGLVSLVLFCLAYAVCARRGYVVALVAGWLAFGLSTALLSAVHPPFAVSAVVTLAAIACGSWLLDRRVASRVESMINEEELVGDLLLWRLVITAAMVVALTAAAHGLSAHLAGLLAPFPIITAVLAGFTQARVGVDAAIELLAGLVRALVCFLTFFVVLAATLLQLGGPAAFGLATVAALVLWAGLVVVEGR